MPVCVGGLRIGPDHDQPKPFQDQQDQNPPGSVNRPVDGSVTGTTSTTAVQTAACTLHLAKVLPRMVGVTPIMLGVVYRVVEAVAAAR